MDTHFLYVPPYKWSDDLFTSGIEHEADKTDMIILEARLGTGAYGMVFKSRSTSFPAHVCGCKLFFKSKNEPSVSEEKVNAELAALLTVSQTKSKPSSLVSFYGAARLNQICLGADAKAIAKEDMCDTVLLMEYINGGTLTSWLKEYDDLIDFDYVHSCLQQSVRAVHYLHEKSHLLHRDIKPSNFLVRAPHLPVSRNISGRHSLLSSERRYLLHHSELVLTDFGEATSCDSDSEAEAQRRIVGTPGFCAPEILKMWGCQAHCSYGKKADIWSLAAIFYVYLTLDVSGCDQGMLTLFSSLTDANSLFSGEAVSILLLSKCVFPTLMQLRYGAFTSAQPTENAMMKQQNPGTLSEEAYTRYTVMDEGANMLNQWEQHMEQFSKMQRHLSARWSSVPDAFLQIVDTMMSPDPLQRPAASLLLDRLNGVNAISTQPRGQWDHFIAYQVIVEWHVMLMDVDSCLEELIQILHQSTKVDKHTIRAYLPSISQFKTYIQAKRGDVPSLQSPLKDCTTFFCLTPPPTPNTLLEEFTQTYITGGCP